MVSEIERNSNNYNKPYLYNVLQKDIYLYKKNLVNLLKY